MLTETIKKSEEFKKWTKTYRKVTLINNEDDANVLVICLNKNGTYDLLRFFTVGCRVMISADQQDVSANAILEALNEELNN